MTLKLWASPIGLHGNICFLPFVILIIIKGNWIKLQIEIYLENINASCESLESTDNGNGLAVM